MNSIIVPTAKLITEIKSRPCLWNTKLPDYGDLNAKRLAWEQVAVAVFEDYALLEDNEKQLKVEILRKRWKGVRDYFMRERKKGRVGDKSNRGKGLTCYMDMLLFLLDSKRNERTTKPAQKRKLTTDVTDESSSSSEGFEEIKVEPMEETLVSECSIPDYMNENTLSMQPTHENDPNMSFLLSILPDMNSMTGRQQCDFKLQVLQSIKNIKYSK